MAAELPPPGWYDDPDASGMLRYWDGLDWSEHRTPLPPARNASSSSGLSNIGDFLSQTFRTLFARWIPMAILAALLVVVGWLFGLALAAALGDLGYDDGVWTGTEDIAATLVPAGLGFAAATLAIYMVACHQLYHARLGMQPTLGASAAATLRRLPLAFLWAGAVVMALAIAIFVGSLVGLVIPVLGLFVVLAVFIFAAVKLAFLVPALVVPIESMHSLRASVEVSKDRFWPVLGRLAITMVVLFPISLVTQAVTNAFTASGIDIEQYYVVDDGEVIFADVGGLIDELDVTSPVGALLSLPSVLAGLVWLSAVSVLFAETHQVRPGSPGSGDDKSDDEGALDS